MSSTRQCTYVLVPLLTDPLVSRSVFPWRRDGGSRATSVPTVGFLLKRSVHSVQYLLSNASPAWLTFSDSRPCEPSDSEIYIHSLGFGFTDLHLDSLGFRDLHLDSLGFRDLYPDSLGFRDLHADSLGFCSLSAALCSRCMWMMACTFLWLVVMLGSAMSSLSRRLDLMALEAVERAKIGRAHV